MQSNNPITKPATQSEVLIAPVFQNSRDAIEYANAMIAERGEVIAPSMFGDSEGTE